jgi:hypothetical protein
VIDPATASIIASALPAVASLFGGGGATAKTQRKLMRAQMAEYEWQKANRAKLLALIEGQSNLFNSDRVLRSMYANDFRDMGLETGALGAGYAAAGYRPGDTPVGDGFTRVGQQHRAFRDKLAMEIPLELLQKRIGMMGGIPNPDPGLLSSASSMASAIPERPSLASLLGPVAEAVLNKYTAKPAATRLAGGGGNTLVLNGMPLGGTGLDGMGDPVSDWIGSNADALRKRRQSYGLPGYDLSFANRNA